MPLPFFIASRKQAIILMGIQASGKSTFFRRYLASTHIHVSLDVLRTRHREQTQIASAIAEQLSFAVDNTNLTRNVRAKAIILALNAGYQVIGLFFRSSIKECVQRNDVREGKARVPSHVIASSSNKLELPSHEEGFDALYYVSAKDDSFEI